MNAKSSIPGTTKLFMSEYERPLASAANLPRRIEGAFSASEIMRGMDLSGGGKKGSSVNAGGGVAPGNPYPKSKEQIAHATKVAKKQEQRRKRIVRKLGKGGIKYPLMDEIRKNDGFLGLANERIYLAETLASAASGPGGSDLTDAELAEQVSEYKYLLFLQQRRKGFINTSLGFVSGARQSLSEKIRSASKSGQKWKLPGLRKAFRNAGSTIGDLKGLRTDLLGVTGNGGELFETQMRLRELGVATTSEGAASAAKDSEITALLREQLGLASKNNAILSAQMPIFQQFMPKYHTGGVVPGRTEQPIMAMGGEGVFTKDQMGAMGGPGNVQVTLVIEDDAIDTSKIKTIVNGEMVNAVSKVRRGNVGTPKYRTAGLSG
jgi:hypothetical protein